MNKKTLFFGVLLVAGLGLIFKNSFKQTSDIEILRKKHAEFLKNHPYQKTAELPKKQRKAQGLPPNAYFEQKYLSEINPATGRTHKENIYKLQEKLNKRRLAQKVPGEADNAWEERGPDNVGGRTRAVIFDPNDATNETVFAGGVSGGLWKNTNISNPDSRWVRIGIPENLAVSCIAVDPNNPQILYVGTGESYTNGDANGDGLWKSTDGGNSWNKVFGGATGVTNSVFVPGIFHINDMAIRNNAGISEIYVAVGEAAYIGGAFLGSDEFGVYKSLDNGVNFTKIDMPKTIGGNEHEPNNIKISIDNSIYVSTTRSARFGDGGGVIFKSSDGNTFQTAHSVLGGVRTEIALSPTNANTLYVLAQMSNNTNPVKIVKTEDNFSTTTELALPEDADNGIPATDFTRGQSFYDLLIRVDPNDENIVYVGGIDLFKTIDGGTSWDQISKWSNNNNLAALNVSEVHADQHGLAFASSDRMVFSNDGGVYFSNNAGNNISARNNNYNTLQFYTIGVAPKSAFGGAEFFLAGAQDNGTQLIQNATNGINSSQDVSGGDGAASFFDVDGTDRYFITNFVYNQSISLYNFDVDASVTINSENSSNGDFINQEDLDSNLNILYTNYSSAGFVIRRYSNILSSFDLEKSILSNSLMNSEPSSLKVSPHTTTSSTLFVGLKNGRLLKIENANEGTGTWSAITGSQFVGTISDIEFGSTENEIFVTMHNYGVTNVWYSSNGGTSWLNKEGDLPDIPVKSILQNPLNPNEVIIGTDLGVWKTSNFNIVSPNWVQAYNGMSNVPVLDLDLRDDNTVFAATHGRGIFSGKFISDPNGDDDGDGVLNGVDNCPSTANADQLDADANGIGDVCQDSDDDGVIDSIDNCPNNANVDQIDLDGNGVGDACQDTDSDGVFDNVDNCIDVKNADQADINNNGIGDVCDTSYENQGSIFVETISETCVNQNDGKITINVTETFVDYTITLNGASTQQISGTTASTSYNDLDPGSYEVCVSVDGRSYTQCFEVNIVAASNVQLRMEKKQEGQEYSFNITSGTAPYNVYVNDKLVGTFNESNFTVKIEERGVIEVKTAKACEKSFKTIIDSVFLKQNPVSSSIELVVPSNLNTSNVDVSVFDLSGRVVLQQKAQLNGSNLSIPFESFKTGLYIVKLGIENTQPIKILKQ